MSDGWVPQGSGSMEHLLDGFHRVPNIWSMARKLFRALAAASGDRGAGGVGGGVAVSLSFELGSL